MSFLVSHWVCQYSQRAAESNQKSVLLGFKKHGLSSSTHHHLRSIQQHVENPLSIVSAPSVYSNISVCTHVSTDLPLQCVFYAVTWPSIIFGWFMWSKILLRNSRTLLSGLLMLVRSCYQASVTINSRAHKYVYCNPFIALQIFAFPSNCMKDPFGLFVWVLYSAVYFGLIVK